jgi:mono/diheme cytochrome c family protein
MKKRFVRTISLVVAGFAALVWAGVAGSAPADAIPLFANGQGVSCGQCHSAPPNLNPYGRYIMVTNFSKVLNAHAQMMQNLKEPISVITMVGGSNVRTPNLPTVILNSFQLNSGGYLGQDFTYYASVPIVESGFPASGLDQLWFAYNGFSKGNGSLQVGDFPTPVMSPWLSQSMSLAGYALGEMAVGLNTVGVGDNRWGVSYSQIGTKGLVGNVSYMANEGALESAFDNDPDDAQASAVGQAYTVSLQEMNFSSHFTGGLAQMWGNYPLPSGAKDAYNRTFGLVSYSTAPNYSIIGMALIGHDSNPNDGPGDSASNGWSFEGIGSPTPWLHLDGRYERTNDGLGGIANNYVGDIAFSIMPNLTVTFENASTVGGPAVTSYQVLWGAPFNRPKNAPTTVATAPSAPAATAPATGATAAPAAPDDLALGQQVFSTNCSACHGANGQGGVGPSLRGIAAKQTLDQTIAFIEKPSGAMPKYYPSVISAAQVHAVADYIRETFK